jgi:hypothetical protein
MVVRAPCAGGGQHAIEVVSRRRIAVRLHDQGYCDRSGDGHGATQRICWPDKFDAGRESVMIKRALPHGGGSNRRTFLLAAFALTGTLLGGRRAAAWIPSEATTSAGRVQGYFSAGIHVFKGVPYAASTTNTRFAAPIPPKPWSGLRPAWQWPAECPQHNPPAGGDVGTVPHRNE